MRRRLALLAVFTALVAGGLLYRGVRESQDAPPSDASPSPRSAPAIPREAARAALADGLNDPAGTIDRDLAILADLLAHWSTNFPRAGNPVGSNAEITAALSGRNPLGLELLPPDHPAIGRTGELVDRWGTPFRFHQWSGAEMEVVSAGPDRRFATGDDVSSPGGDEDDHPGRLVR